MNKENITLSTAQNDQKVGGCALGKLPRLRFPEFWEEDWKEKPLKKVFSIFQGFAFSSKDSINNGTRWLKIADVSIQKMNHSTPSYLPARYKDKYKKFLVKQGDFVIALTRPILSKQLKIASVDEIFHNALLNQRVGKVVTTQNISFVYFLLQTSQLISNIETGISGSEPPNLSAKQIENIITLIPPVIEQQKIANCLTSLDQLITAHAQKLDTLKAHKKGLMQQLFPAEGKTVPNYRFPEFRDAGDWEEKKLKSVCKMQAGKFVPASKIYETLENDLHPCYGGNGLRGFTKTYTNIGRYSLIGRQGALCGNITFVTGKFHATEHAVVTTPTENTDTDWLYFLLILLNLNQYATGQAQPGLSVKNLEEIIVKIPSDKKEQQKAANCLTSLNQIITAQAEKVAQLKAHKKGLMQQLFPQ